jgi:hypothetical protein
MSWRIGQFLVHKFLPNFHFPNLCCNQTLLLPPHLYLFLTLILWQYQEAFSCARNGPPTFLEESEIFPLVMKSSRRRSRSMNRLLRWDSALATCLWETSNSEIGLLHRHPHTLDAAEKCPPPSVLACLLAATSSHCLAPHYGFQVVG